MVRWGRVAPGLLLAVLIPAAWAEACSCARVGPACEVFGKTDAVFVGRVTSVSSWIWTFFTGERRVWFAVSEGFRGVGSGEAVRVVTGTGAGDCGYGFEEGGEYVVYAHRSRGGELRTSICTRTRGLAAAAEDLAFLREGGPPGGRIYGRVRRHTKRGWEAGSGVTVRVSGGGEPHEAVSNEYGTFELVGLPPGQYEIVPETPEHFVSNRVAREVLERGCAEVELQLVEVGKVEGRLVDARGRPVGGLGVDLLRWTGYRAVALYEVPQRKTSEDGRFRFEKVPAGSYVLGVNLRWGPRPETPYWPTYYPGVGELEQAQVIEVGAGEKNPPYRLRLPEALPGRMIELRVVWPGGEGVPEASVQVILLDFSDSNGWPRIFATGRTDRDGRLRVEGLVGVRYVAWASGHGSLGRSRCAEPQVIEAQEAAPSVELVLSQPNTGCFAVWWRSRQPPRRPPARR
ncbi:MAG: hypothetical protein ACE5G6_04020 [Terriglobia bacterium]